MTMEQQVTASVATNDVAFTIAGWTVDPATLRIDNHNSSEKLEPKVMAVLEYLAARPGQVVSRKELEENVWTGTVVGYDAISNAIIKLRKAFGDDAQHPQIIETIPKSGYRLIAAVEATDYEEVDEGHVEQASSPDSNNPAPANSGLPVKPASRDLKPIIKIGLPIIVLGIVALLWLKPSEPKVEPASIERMAFALPDKPSIAVLPFNNMSDDPKQEYFVDGMTEDLITDLSKLSGLFVVARNSVFTYKGRAVKIRDVAEDLGVRYVLEGSVRRVDDNVRINAQLIDALSGGHIWAERYDGVIGDVFTLQDQVSRGIVEQLAVNLSLDEGKTDNPSKPAVAEAYDLFLKGWGYYRSGSANDYKSAIEIFSEVIEIDPDFNRAHAALAASYWQIIVNAWWQESLGVHYYEAFELARKSLRQSQQNPTVLTHQVASEWIIHFTKRRGSSTRRALEEARKALKLDPNHPAGHLALANALLHDDKPKEAERAIRAAMRLDPHYPVAYLVRLAKVRFQLSEYQDAADLLEQARKSNPNDSWTNLYLAASYGQLGQVERAQEALSLTNKIRARDGWGPVTIVSVAHPDFRWQGDKDALKQGLRAAGTPVGGEWYQLIGYVGQNQPPLIEGVTVIEVSQAKLLHEQGAIFVDTRSTWLTSHIPGSHFLEWWGEGWRFNEVSLSRLGSKDAKIVVYAFDGNSKLAMQAAALAVSRGFTNIYLFDGGLDDWKKAGYATESPKDD